MTFARQRIVRSLLACALLGLMASALPLAVQPAAAAGSQLSYIVMPHPDDEWGGWSLIANSTGNNKIFLFATNGEQTGACSSAGQAWYEGSDGETQPSNPPWNAGGQWSSACIASRRSSTLGQLNDRAATDPTLPTFVGSSPSTKCFSGNTRAGLPPQRKDGGLPYTSNCAVVYQSTNGYGTAIFFDLGDADLTKEEVEWAVLAVKNNKSYVGVANLPDFNIIGGYRNLVNYGTACAVYDHTDHRAVHEALWNYSMGVTVRWGRTCTNDPDSSTSNGGRTATVTAVDQSSAIAMVGSTRTGTLQKRYGWLIDGYWTSLYTGFDKQWSSTQAFWGRP